MEPVEPKSFWNAAGIAGVIFGFVVFIISLIGNYITILSEPTGSFLSANMVAPVIGCLAGAFGAVLAVKLYINEHGPEMKIGKGAIIGLVTGIIMTVVYQVLTLLWPFIDGSYIENLQTAMIDNAEMMMENLPAEQRAMQDDMIDSIYNQMQNYYSAGVIFMNLFTGVLTYGLLNLLSGLLSAKFMGTRPGEEEL